MISNICCQARLNGVKEKIHELGIEDVSYHSNLKINQMVVKYVSNVDFSRPESACVNLDDK